MKSRIPALHSRARIPRAIPEWLPFPWRLLDPAIRLGLTGNTRDYCDFADGRLFTAERHSRYRVVALGDIALTRIPDDGNYRGRLAALIPLIERADVVTANLEAMLTERTERSGTIGSFMRAEPQAISALAEHPNLVLTLANNHALDFGPEAIDNTIRLLRNHGIGVCGAVNVSASTDRARIEAGAQKITVLGFCDDHQPTSSGASGTKLCLAEEADIELAVCAAVARSDRVLVNLHWGYEFSFHPLLRHRTLARRIVDWGADLVLCHHAHIPMSIERWQHGLIAYGLGNCVMPHSQYQLSGHPWTTRSIALEAGFDEDGLTEVIIHPFEMDPDGNAIDTSPAVRRQTLKALSKASARLDDERFLRQLEGHRLISETLTFLKAIVRPGDHTETQLRERARSLDLPRQRALLNWLKTQSELSSLSQAMTGFAEASATGPEEFISTFTRLRNKAPEAIRQLERQTRNAIRLAAKIP